ncbi:MULTISPECIES: NADH-quinone oxidoreductase subunit C [unclassified Streptomyces]|uniref:NADH-quinone oxidoreductase subunit C n=1 Tax=unclassified Streptomyces TaxID=2593676 RepID=UPI003369F09C
MTAPDDRNQPVEAEPVTAGPVEAAAAPAAAPAQPAVGWLPRPATELFGEEATAEEAYGLLTVDVPADAWIPALETARDALGCTYFDWLSAVDEPGEGFRVAAHVVALGPATAAAAGPGATAPAAAVRGLLVRTTVAHDAPALPTATGVYAGAAWHERETHEMFGIDFADHPHLAPLLLPDGFEGHPLRKDFVLAARVVKAWPGAKEPGESDAAHAPRRRQMLPPGVPDPNEWGPLKGQLPPAPARPARATRTAGAAGAAGAGGERPARRARSASAGSASQRATDTTGAETPADDSARPARRARSAGEGSASQRDAGTAAAAEGAARPVRRSRSASEGSASQRGAGTEEAAGAATEGAPGGAARPARRARSAGEGSASQRAATGGQAQARADRPTTRPRSADAPWHHARPARDEPTDPAPGAEGEGQAEGLERREDPQGPDEPEGAHGPDASAGPHTQAGPKASDVREGVAGPDAPAGSDDPHRPDTRHPDPDPHTDDPAGGTA